MLCKLHPHLLEQLGLELLGPLDGCEGLSLVSFELVGDVALSVL
jgi:hypothetical protein